MLAYSHDRLSDQPVAAAGLQLLAELLLKAVDQIEA
jgi:hypothetical protein